MRAFILTLGLLCAGMAQAQTLERQVLSSTGGYSTGSNLSLEWTMGEIAVATKTNGNLTLTEGFEQATDGTIGLEETELIQSMDIYPNPSADIVHMNWNSEKSGMMTFELYGPKGDLVMTVRENVGSQQATLNMSSLAAGTYLLRILIDDTVQKSSYDLIKMY